jgi:TonB family protein
LALLNIAIFAQDTFTDPRDGKTYKITYIGEQVWIAENIDYRGDDGYLGLCYGDMPRNRIRQPENCKKYGRLYDWKEAIQACPDGWHLPDNKEWQTLVDFAGGNEVAGKKLKAKSGWDTQKCKWTERTGEVMDDRGRILKPATVIEHNKCGTDEYDFSALPGGSHSNGNFMNINKSGGWWSISEYNNHYAYFWSMFENRETVQVSYYNEEVNQYGIGKSGLLAVRCVQGDFSGYEKVELGGRRGSATGGFNDGYAEGGSGGIGNMLGGLMGGSAGGLGTKAKGSLKAPDARDIDMGSGDGARSKQEIMQVVNARMPGLRNIYNKYLKLKPGFSGKVTLKFTIAPGGDIISIAIVSSTTGYSEFDNAVKNMVATWKWKKIKSGNTTPTIPFSFEE